MSTDERRPCGALDTAELVTACKNIGYDLTCGQCASVFYTGAGTYAHEPGCKTIHYSHQDGRRPSKARVLEAAIKLRRLADLKPLQVEKTPDNWRVLEALRELLDLVKPDDNDEGYASAQPGNREQVTLTRERFRGHLVRARESTLHEAAAALRKLKPDPDARVKPRLDMEDAALTVEALIGSPEKEQTR